MLCGWTQRASPISGENWRANLEIMFHNHNDKNVGN